MHPLANRRAQLYTRPISTSASYRTASNTRLFYIDNIRWAMIILVISMHAADTYSPFGNWYFVERRTLRPATILFFAAWQMYLQAFFMGLLFFVAGVFTPGSLQRKGTRRFLSERLLRLGVPVLFYMFVLGPVIEFYVAKSWTSTSRTSFFREWNAHILNGQFLQENGPLWFCLALLIFSTVFAGIETCFPKADHQRSFPSTPEITKFVLQMASLTFLVRLFRPDPLLNMPIRDFAQYILMFWAGVNAAHHGWIKDLPVSTGVRWGVWTVVAGFIAWLLVILFGGAMDGRTGAYLAGWHWQSATICLWESLTCVGVSLWLLVLFRKHVDSRRRIEAFLSDNAFSVYVFHPLVLIVLARLLHQNTWPAVVKFLILTVSSAVVSFVLSAALLRRIPFLRAIL